MCLNICQFYIVCEQFEFLTKKVIKHASGKILDFTFFSNALIVLDIQNSDCFDCICMKLCIFQYPYTGLSKVILVCFPNLLNRT